MLIALLAGLDLLPSVHDLLRALDFSLAEDVRMAANELIGDPVDDIVDIECPLLLRHLGMENYLQQEIAKLATKLLHVAGVDGIHSLVGFLDHVLLEGFVRLLPIPGASTGTPQPRHDINQSLEIAACFAHIYHSYSYSYSKTSADYPG